MRFPLFPPFYERTCVRGDTQLYDYLAETHKSVPSLGYIYSLDLLPLIWRMVVAAAAARQTDNYKIINVERTHIIVSELIATFTWTWVCGRGRRKGGGVAGWKGQIHQRRWRNVQLTAAAATTHSYGHTTRTCLQLSTVSL